MTLAVLSGLAARCLRSPMQGLVRANPGRDNHHAALPTALALALAGGVGSVPTAFAPGVVAAFVGRMLVGTAAIGASPTAPSPVAHLTAASERRQHLLRASPRCKVHGVDGFTGIGIALADKRVAVVKPRRRFARRRDACLEARRIGGRELAAARVAGLMLPA